jgi:hypothetical protein
MKFRGITIIGADHETDVAVLVELSAEFPAVKWGILLPRKRIQPWIEQALSKPVLRPRLAGHVCGHWAESICLGLLLAGLDVSPFDESS